MPQKSEQLAQKQSVNTFSKITKTIGRKQNNQTGLQQF